MCNTKENADYYNKLYLLINKCNLIFEEKYEELSKEYTDFA
jgi:hypothetical protein